MYPEADFIDLWKVTALVRIWLIFFLEWSCIHQNSNRWNLEVQKLELLYTSLEPSSNYTKKKVDYIWMNFYLSVGGCGAIFEVFVSSTEFKGLSVVKQHQLINEVCKCWSVDDCNCVYILST